MANILDVLSGNDQGVSGVELSHIDEGHGQFVCIHNARRPSLMGDFTEYTMASMESPLELSGALNGLPQSWQGGGARHHGSCQPYDSKVENWLHPCPRHVSI